MVANERGRVSDLRRVRSLTVSHSLSEGCSNVRSNVPPHTGLTANKSGMWVRRLQLDMTLIQPSLYAQRTFLPT